MEVDLCESCSVLKVNSKSEHRFQERLLHIKQTARQSWQLVDHLILYGGYSLGSH